MEIFIHENIIDKGKIAYKSSAADVSKCRKGLKTIVLSVKYVFIRCFFAIYPIPIVFKKLPWQVHQVCLYQLKCLSNEDRSLSTLWQARAVYTFFYKYKSYD